MSTPINKLESAKSLWNAAIPEEDKNDPHSQWDRLDYKVQEAWLRMADYVDQQTTHLREQLQLSQSQVGRCVEVLGYYADEDKWPEVGFKGESSYNVPTASHAKELLKKLPTAPNYVKRVEELEERITKLRLWWLKKEGHLVTMFPTLQKQIEECLGINEQQTLNKQV